MVKEYTQEERDLEIAVHKALGYTAVFDKKKWYWLMRDPNGHLITNVNEARGTEEEVWADYSWEYLNKSALSGSDSITEVLNALEASYGKENSAWN